MPDQLPPLPKRVENILFLMLGDAKMNYRLRELYEYGSVGPDFYDPTAMNGKGRDDRPKLVQHEDMCYRVQGMETDRFESGQFTESNNLATSHPTVFQSLAQVLIFTYDVSSKDSFLNMCERYEGLPTPREGRIEIKLMRIDRNISKNGDVQDKLVHEERYISMDHFPVVFAGCRYPAESVREVEKEDVEAFAHHHPDWKFAGECMLEEDRPENVDQVFRVALEVYHSIRRVALQQGALDHIVDSRPHKQQRSPHCCVVL
ncbi:uncharacterized protein LY89DRAFT_354224 [Mollisia scopiformis]|uniref:Uncharacterized protein n=1 Tax=Mollisia scopiformis TaxID=149040 RepID=A0A132B664_MOLSC|nr:uncharacterized protein LY89DRAFT_354224 [Mollisia scopiformis]KUJ07892.1 hypothetical protein LY89DRAFT_354224 [Mollisia scopiformis]